MMTDIAGILRDKDDPATLIPMIDIWDAAKLYGEGVISPSVYMIWNTLTPLDRSRELKPYRYFDFPIGASIYNDVSFGKEFVGHKDCTFHNTTTITSEVNNVF